MSGSLGYAVLEVGGIQNFILGTGKLKEMLGGSELVESLSKGFLEGVCVDGGLTLVSAKEAREPRDREVLALQRNAGSVHLLFPTHDGAKAFVSAYCLKAFDVYPGLPLFAATASCSWDRASIAAARREASGSVDGKRARRDAACGMAMHPLCRRAPLDALPAVAQDGDEWVSLPSATRRRPDLIAGARRRLQALLHEDYRDYVDANSDDLERLAGDVGKVALVHIDGNDLGNLFRSRIAELNDRGCSVEEGIKSMDALSSLVEASSRAAFKKALNDVVAFDFRRRYDTSSKRLVMPVRPLVLGGDDVTAIVRADVALLFVDSFVREFERISAERGHRLSVGVGMVACAIGYPFHKAFGLAEALLESAKKLTAGQDPADRPSSLDYVVLTNDAEGDLDAMRRHIATSADGRSLTGKPFVLKDGFLGHFVSDALKVLDCLPRSGVRPAMDECRKGEEAAAKAWRQMTKNLERGLGGRANGSLLSKEAFRVLFPKGFFRTEGGKTFTLLGDYLELGHLLPVEHGDYLKMIRDEGGR